MSRIKLVSAVLCVAVMTALVGCGLMSPGPGAVVKSFFGAVQKGNITEAISYLELPAGMEPKVSMILATQGKEMQKSLESVEILKEEIHGETAHVDYRRHRKPVSGSSAGTTEDDSMNLRKVDGKWRIQPGP